MDQLRNVTISIGFWGLRANVISYCLKLIEGCKRDEVLTHFWVIYLSRLWNEALLLL